MPFPPINFCIVCEGIRPELGGKLSILGFFGVTPNVDIGVVRLEQPLSVTVVLGFGVVPDANPYNHSIVVRNPDGSVLFQSPTARVNTVLRKPGLLVSTFVAIPRVAGLRTVKVIVDGQESPFEGQFMIRLATPQELAGMPGAGVH
jgi:hypothetical protein